MQAIYLFLSALSAASAITFWPLSGAFVNWFWQDEKEEAEMILADERSATKYSKNFSGTAVLLLLGVLALLGSLLYFSGAPKMLILVKSVAIIYFLFLAIVDFRTMMLPDILNYIGLWFGLLLATFNLNPFGLSIQTCVLGAFGGYMVCWLVIQTGYFIFKKGIMGHGDAKYLAMLGAWFGFKPAYLCFVMAMVILTIFSLLRTLFTKDGEFNKPTPFGPFLCTAAIILVIYYEPILAYMHSSYPSLF